MPNKTVLSVGVDGRVEGLYLDNLDLSSVGKKKVQRVSLVVHDETTDTFGVYLQPDDFSCLDAQGFARYSEAVAFEVEWLNACRSRNIDPRSGMGVELARTLRDIR